MDTTDRVRLRVAAAEYLLAKLVARSLADAPPAFVDDLFTRIEDGAPDYLANRLGPPADAEEAAERRAILRESLDRIRGETGK